jgi:two-component system sensor histidine kinase BaeS
VTADRPRFGPLGRRLLAAFLVVAFFSVLVLTGAALVGSDQGLTAARQADRHQAAVTVAGLAARAYQAAGGWQHADLGAAVSAATGAGARLLVRDSSGAVVRSPGGQRPQPGHRPPPGYGPGTGSGTGTGGSGTGAGGSAGASGGTGTGGTGTGGTGSAGASGGTGGTGSAGQESALVVAGGRTAGTVVLLFGTPAAPPGRDVAWSWIAAAAVAALAVALAVSWFVSRRLAVPLVRLAGAARAFARGDRSARSGVTAPGELGELGRAFDGMADEVARAETARRLLAADIAHELRNPLSALQAGLEELRDGLESPSPERLGGLHDQALRLGRIVGDLGELSAAESVALSLRMARTDLADLARSVLAAREPQLRAAGLEVRADLPASLLVPADADRIHQALGNLLGNAAEYCRPGDSVTVRVAGTGQDALVQVADTGPGIPEEELPHVFDRLWRGRGAAAVSGRGIGLAVVREIVAAHGGTVTAGSGPDGGATFTMTLPLVSRSPPRSGPVPTPGPPR